MVSLPHHHHHRNHLEPSIIPVVMKSRFRAAGKADNVFYCIRRPHVRAQPAPPTARLIPCPPQPRKAELDRCKQLFFLLIFCNLLLLLHHFLNQLIIFIFSERFHHFWAERPPSLIPSFASSAASSRVSATTHPSHISLLFGFLLAKLRFCIIR
jgi:hypothetical protein